MTTDELDSLYQRATANRTPHGAQSWAADLLAVDVRTVRRWCAGETRPTGMQRARLRIAAAVAERARRIGWRRPGVSEDRVIDAMAARRQTRMNDAFGLHERDLLPGGRCERYPRLRALRARWL